MMTLHFATMLLALVPASVARGAGDRPSNLDFEQGEVGKPPPGWVLPANMAKAGYSVELTADQPKQGKQCAVVSWNGSGRPGRAIVYQTIDAEKYRDRSVRFTAAVKVRPTGPDDQVRLWFRANMPDGQMGFANARQRLAIKPNEWVDFETVAEIPRVATTLVIGLEVFGGATVWFDNAAIAVVEADVHGDEPPRPISPRGRDNLVAFTRLVGYVRYFHPSDEAAQTDWERLIINHVAAAEAAPDASELARVLDAMIKPIAPTAHVIVTGQPDPPAFQPDKPNLKTLMWRHDGLGGKNPNSVYRSKRVTAGDLNPLFRVKQLAKLEPADPAKPFKAELPGGVTCIVPLAVYAEEGGTLPRATAQPPKPAKAADFAPTSADRATRLASVIITWNAFQHFYPYFDVVKTDWPAALTHALDRAAVDTNADAHHETLKRLVAALHDGHGGVYGGANQRGVYFFLPFACEWVENQLVVTHVFDPKAADVRPGDVIMTINNRPTAAFLARIEETISGATPQWKRFQAIRHLLSGPRDSEVKLTRQRGDAPAQPLAIKRTMPTGVYFQKGPGRPEKIAEVKPGIWYVDLDRVTDKDFSDAVPKLEKAKGIVFDVRGYPTCGTSAISHITDKPLTCAQWHIPVFTRPDRAAMTFCQSNWPVLPQKPRFTAKVAFLTDGRAISYAETYLGIIEHYKLADIVGGPTAGTNGNVNPLTVPGGFSIMWTGMKVLKHDGSQHHGVGIQPTVPAQRTIAGIRAGKDEVLEKGIAVVGG